MNKTLTFSKVHYTYDLADAYYKPMLLFVGLLLVFGTIIFL
jgi:hypothetical protein